MLKNWTDKVNGYGVLFRFLTPFIGTLVAIISTMTFNTLNDIKKEQVEVRKDLMIYQTEARIYNNNHLEHHRANEIKIEGRLSCIETELKRIK